MRKTNGSSSSGIKFASSRSFRTIVAGSIISPEQNNGPTHAREASQDREEERTEQRGGQQGGKIPVPFSFCRFEKSRHTVLTVHSFAPALQLQRNTTLWARLTSAEEGNLPQRTQVVALPAMNHPEAGKDKDVTPCWW